MQLPHEDPSSKKKSKAEVSKFWIGRFMKPIKVEQPAREIAPEVNNNSSSKNLNTTVDSPAADDNAQSKWPDSLSEIHWTFPRVAKPLGCQLPQVEASVVVKEQDAENLDDTLETVSSNKPEPAVEMFWSDQKPRNRSLKKIIGAPSIDSHYTLTNNYIAKFLRTFVQIMGRVQKR